MYQQTKPLFVLAVAAVVAACGGSIFDSSSSSSSVSSDELACSGGTIGFWSNKNGAALIDADDLAYFEDFRLVDASGAPVALTQKNLPRFLRGASAKSMASMLSAQWVAFALNHSHDFFCSELDVTFVFPDFPQAGEGPDGTVTFEQIATEVQRVLAEGSGATRGEMEILKSFLDAVNNGAARCSCRPPTGATGGFSR